MESMAHRIARRGAEYALQVLGMSVLLCLAVETAPSREPPAAAMLEPRDVESVGGTVVRVRSLPRADRGVRDVTLVLRTDIGDEFQVALAPRRVVQRLGLRLRSGDEVLVSGWRIVRGKPALLAAEITLRGRLFVLRDRQGSPTWKEHP
jgi:hypothetical protein